jgi:hypothetical protein
MPLSENADKFTTWFQSNLIFLSKEDLFVSLKCVIRK